MILISSNCAIIPESSCLERGQIIWRSAVSLFLYPSPLFLPLFLPLFHVFSFIFCLSHSLSLISAAHTLLLLSSNLPVRIHSTVAATVKRDIFLKQKIAKEGVRICASKKLFAVSQTQSKLRQVSHEMCLAAIWVHLKIKNHKHMNTLTVSDQLADHLTLCDLNLCTDVMLQPHDSTTVLSALLTWQSYHWYPTSHGIMKLDEAA